MDLTDITEKISQSKKYHTIYQPTIKRIVEQTAKRYPPKQIEQQARNKLHQIWGAYYSTRPNFPKLYKKLQSDLTSGVSIKEVVLPVLKLQSSTAERLPILDDFYSKIFQITGTPKSIIDYACGLNPLSYFWMNLPNTTKYTAQDIDLEEIFFLQNIFNHLNLPQIEVMPGDLFSLENNNYDLAFLLKTIPVLEQQQKGITTDLINKIPAKYLVISFPTKSIGGQEKGMIDNYSKEFENTISTKFAKITFPSELVYIITK